MIISSSIICSNKATTDSQFNDIWDYAATTNADAVIYSCLGTNPGFAGAGIISVDPGFVDFSGGNFRLVVNSPCINTGSNENWMTGGAVDLDGRTRIQYGTVDMGAYERIRSGTIFSGR